MDRKSWKFGKFTLWEGDRVEATVSASVDMTLTIHCVCGAPHVVSLRTKFGEGATVSLPCGMVFVFPPLQWVGVCDGSRDPVDGAVEGQIVTRVVSPEKRDTP